MDATLKESKYCSLLIVYNSVGFGIFKEYNSASNARPSIKSVQRMILRLPSCLFEAQ